MSGVRLQIPHRCFLEKSRLHGRLWRVPHRVSRLLVYREYLELILFELFVSMIDLATIKPLFLMNFDDSTILWCMGLLPPR